ncbi:MAG: O-antigen ligase family protein [Candidatus Saccharimonadales bacterium]
MYTQKFVNWITWFMPTVALLIIVLVPFQGILTVGLSQLFGHYTILRLWKEFLMILLAIGAVYIVVKNKKIRTQLFKSKLTWLIATFIFVELLWGIVAYLTHQVSTKALGYSWISDNRYFIFFLNVWIIAAATPKIKNSWPKIVFWPAAVVIVFGLLQYFILPYNFMTHFGYSSATIFPYEDINSNIHYIRIMSTLRGANPLGAYLIVVLSLAIVLWRQQKKWWLVALAGAGTLALIFSFSRAAWLGLVLGLITLFWIGLKSRGKRQWTLVGLVVCLIVAVVVGLGLRNNATFQNIFLHTQTSSVVQSTSDQGHVSDIQSGLGNVLTEPLGRGPGTAGPASVYNSGHPARIAENYFIQIGQETGWIGLALFVAINLAVAVALWRRRAHPLALGLLIALIGISFANLLSPAWTDDTLCYLWWGLAAIACTIPLKRLKPEDYRRRSLIE